MAKPPCTAAESCPRVLLSRHQNFSPYSIVHPRRPSVITIGHRQIMAVRTMMITLLLGLLGLVSAHNIQMKAHTRECFHEQLHIDDTMTVTFQVGDREFGGSGNLDIDFWVGLQSHYWYASADRSDCEPQQFLRSIHSRSQQRRPFIRCKDGRQAYVLL